MSPWRSALLDLLSFPIVSINKKGAGRRPAVLVAAGRLRYEKLPQLSVFGGCCGTDHRHIQAICDTCVP
jgi:hypothetical protein